jgi:hypothetical protein
MARLPTRHTLQYYTPNTLETAPLPHFSATLPTHRRCLLGLLGFHRAGTSVRGVGRANPDGYSKSCEIPHASDGNKSTNRVGYDAARISHVFSIQALRNLNKVRRCQHVVANLAGKLNTKVNVVVGIAQHVKNLIQPLDSIRPARLNPLANIHIRIPSRHRHYSFLLLQPPLIAIPLLRNIPRRPKHCPRPTR